MGGKFFFKRKTERKTREKTTGGGFSADESKADVFKGTKTQTKTVVLFFLGGHRNRE